MTAQHVASTLYVAALALLFLGASLVYIGAVSCALHPVASFVECFLGGTMLAVGGLFFGEACREAERAT
jgi:hypothetical protein